MRTEILNDFVELKENEIDNGNRVLKYTNNVGEEIHNFQIATLEPFNLVRASQYNDSEVVDGDIICHKKWFEYDEVFKDAYDNDNPNPMEISWDHRFYVIVKSYNGKAYAVNISPYFYSELVSDKNKLGLNERGLTKQLIIPIENLSDNYVFALTDSFIFQNFLRCSSSLIKPSLDIISHSLTNMYEISSGDLISLRFIAFINSLRENGHQNIVVSCDGSKYYRQYFELTLNHIIRTMNNLRFKFIGSYLEDNKDVIICRPEVASLYERNGYTIISFRDMINGKYINNDITQSNVHIRKRTD